MPLMDFVVAALAVALLVHLTGVNNHPRVQATLAWVYASATLWVLQVTLGWRFVIYALATGFVAVVLSRLVGLVTPPTESREVRSVNLRSRVPRL